MHRFQRLMVALINGPGDGGLLRYAAAVARLSSTKEVRFVHVPAVGDGAPTHDAILQTMKQAVAEEFRDVPQDVACHFDILEGPLTDRLLAHVADKGTDLLLAGRRTSTP